MRNLLTLAVAVTALTPLWASDPLDEPAPKDFLKFLKSCVRELSEQQKVMAKKWEFDDYDDGQVLDHEKGTITFLSSKPGVKKLVARAQVIGTLDEKTGTWEWAWADENIGKALKRDTLKMRAYGKRNPLELLTKGSLDKFGRSDARALTALAFKLLGSEGAFVMKSEKRLYFMLMRDLKLGGEE